MKQMRGYNDCNGKPLLTQAPATVDDFRNIISQLQDEVSDLKKRISQLESKQGSWLDRVFKN